MSLLSLVAPVVGLIKTVLAGGKEAAREAARAADNRMMSAVGLVVVILWGYPWAGAFVPALAPGVRTGVEIVKTYPPWYVDNWIVLSLTIAGVAVTAKAVRR